MSKVTVEYEAIVPVYTDGHVNHWLGGPICKVVRCRKCRFCKPASHYYGTTDQLLCTRWHTLRLTEPGDFCSRGESED